MYLLWTGTLAALAWRSLLATFSLTVLEVTPTMLGARLQGHFAWSSGPFLGLQGPGQTRAELHRSRGFSLVLQPGSPVQRPARARCLGESDPRWLHHHCLCWAGLLLASGQPLKHRTLSTSPRVTSLSSWSSYSPLPASCPFCALLTGSPTPPLSWPEASLCCSPGQPAASPNTPIERNAGTLREFRSSQGPD